MMFLIIKLSEITMQGATIKISVKAILFRPSGIKTWIKNRHGCVVKITAYTSKSEHCSLLRPQIPIKIVQWKNL